MHAPAIAHAYVVTGGNPGVGGLGDCCPRRACSAPIRRKGRCERAGPGGPPRRRSIAGFEKDVASAPGWSADRRRRVSSAGRRRPPVPSCREVRCERAGPGGPPRRRSIVGTENPRRARAPGLRGGGESPAPSKLRQARRASSAFSALATVRRRLASAPEIDCRRRESRGKRAGPLRRGSVTGVPGTAQYTGKCRKIKQSRVHVMPT